MSKYIKVDEGFQDILSRINLNLSMVEVKGESVLHLFNARMLLQQLVEKPIEEKEILISNKKEE